MTDKSTGGAAFPSQQSQCHDGTWNQTYANDMTLRDWFAGQALANQKICTGTAPDYQITYWFGRNRTAITSTEICAKQAYEYADAMLEARK